MNREERERYVFELEKENIERQTLQKINDSKQKNRENTVNAGVNIINAFMAQQTMALMFQRLDREPK